MKKSFIFALTNVLEFLNIHITCEDEKLLYTNADDMMVPPKKTAKSKKAKGTLDNKAANAKTVTKDRILATNQSSNTRISGTINIQTRMNNSIAPKTAAPKTVAPKTATKGDGKENAVQKANVEATTTSKQPPKTAPKPITGIKKFFQNKPIHMDLTPTASEAERAKEFRDAAYALYKNDPERGNKIFNPHVYEARLRALNKSKVATVPTTIPEAAKQTASTELMETDDTEAENHHITNSGSRTLLGQDDPEPGEQRPPKLGPEDNRPDTNYDEVRLERQTHADFAGIRSTPMGRIIILLQESEV